MLQLLSVEDVAGFVHQTSWHSIYPVKSGGFSIDDSLTVDHGLLVCAVSWCCLIC